MSEILLTLTDNLCIIIYLHTTKTKNKVKMFEFFCKKKKNDTMSTKNQLAAK